MSEVYLAIYSIADLCLAPIETIITLFTIKYCKSSINIKLIPTKQDLTERAYIINLSNFVYEIINMNEIPYYASLCELPNIVINENSCVSGLCAVLRQIVKDVIAGHSIHYCNSLLGFKGSCLMACSEASIWTKFCEVDLIITLKSLDKKDLDRLELPISLARFECHMSQPVRLHNLHKYTMCKKFAALNIVKQDEKGLLEHTYAEVVVNESLYKSDPKRYKPRNYTYTKQEDIQHSLQLVEDINISMELDAEPFGKEINLDWSNVPFDATPEGGSLPPARLQRKQEQLQNLCKPVLKLAKTGDIIVDFCSGSGHLGILIAYLLPDCTIILLENKEESLNRAKKRVQRLKLTNVKFCQCNLDYFKADFDIGTSLHACGLVTDLVIRCCIQKNAIFVSCPCCYGSLQDCHQLTYPRSDIFKKHIGNKEYSFLSHAADQTHEELNIKTKQGYRCMTIVDTDRKLFAEQFGYKVYFTKLVPETCTLKNHLLVGIPNDKLANGNV
ncbi:glutathione S-transferase C-terminal domain-containing protein isoform X2 [Polyergus mexicanus]|uniref:glutathione S-transferase C-terminal domain-containing protein isoform X2 n=1 Tax=Polyergus mexicanus TaxID=615972 RepID=UPI0038B5D87E